MNFAPFVASFRARGLSRFNIYHTSFHPMSRGAFPRLAKHVGIRVTGWFRCLHLERFFAGKLFAFSGKYACFSARNGFLGYVFSNIERLKGIYSTKNGTVKTLTLLSFNKIFQWLFGLVYAEDAIKWSIRYGHINKPIFWNWSPSCEKSLCLESAFERRR